MELDDNPHFKTEQTDNLQSSSNQSVLTQEPCTSSQSELKECIKIESEQTEEPCSSAQFELNKEKCIKIESEQTGEPCTIGQSESNEGQSTTTESEHTVQSIPNEDQGIKIECEETGDYVASVHESGETESECISMQSEPAEDQHTSKTSGSAVMQCETVVSRVSGSGSLALLSMQYRGNSSDDNCSDRSDSSRITTLLS